MGEVKVSEMDRQAMFAPKKNLRKPKTLPMKICCKEMEKATAQKQDCGSPFLNKLFQFEKNIIFRQQRCPKY